jgi:hypothetical protein
VTVFSQRPERLQQRQKKQAFNQSQEKRTTSRGRADRINRNRQAFIRGRACRRLAEKGEAVFKQRQIRQAFSVDRKCSLLAETGHTVFYRRQERQVLAEAGHAIFKRMQGR